MSGDPPRYGFTGAPPYYQASAPPPQYPGAPPQYQGAPPQYPGAPPQYPGVAPPMYPGVPAPAYSYPGINSGAAPNYFPAPGAQSTTNFYPAGETQFTNSFTSFAQAGPPTSFEQGPSWVSWQKHEPIPANAVQGGFDIDGSHIYVGRLHHKGDLVPAKVIPQKQVAYIPYAGQEIAFPSCEILCKQGVNWIPHSNGGIPPRAILAGRTSTGEQLYVGRVQHKGSMTIGKVHPSHQVCYIAFDGKEIAFKNYEVLSA